MFQLLEVNIENQTFWNQLFYPSKTVGKITKWTKQYTEYYLFINIIMIRTKVWVYDIPKSPMLHAYIRTLIEWKNSPDKIYNADDDNRHNYEVTDYDILYNYSFI